MVMTTGCFPSVETNNVTDSTVINSNENSQNKTIEFTRCFARKIETLYAVVAVFIDAYNRFGLAKYNYRQRKKNGELPFSVVDFL